MTAEVRQYKDGISWEYDIRFEMPDGRKIRERRKWKLQGDRDACQKWADTRERELYAELKKGGAQRRKRGPMLETYVPVYLAALKGQHKKPSTIGLRRSNANKWLVPSFGNMCLADIETSDVETLKGMLAAQELGSSATNNVLETLSAILHYAVKVKLIDEVPCVIEYVPDVKVELDFHEQHQLDALLNAAGDEQRVAILLGSHAGLRAGEILGLHRKDIDFARGKIHVQRAYWCGELTSPKHGKDRWVPMSRELAQALRAYPQRLGSPFVLSDAKGKPYDRPTLSGWLADCERAAGLEVTGRVHKLRHTFCSLLALKGVNVQVIQKMAGHHSITVTERYMHLAPNSEADAIVATFNKAA